MVLFFGGAGLIILLWASDGLLGGEMLPAAGRKGNFPKGPTGAPIRLDGLEARLYGAFFFVFGLLLIDFGFRLPVTSWLGKRLRDLLGK